MELSNRLGVNVNLILMRNEDGKPAISGCSHMAAKNAQTSGEKVGCDGHNNLSQEHRATRDENGKRRGDNHNKVVCGEDTQDKMLFNEDSKPFHGIENKSEPELEDAEYCLKYGAKATKVDICKLEVDIKEEGFEMDLNPNCVFNGESVKHEEAGGDDCAIDTQTKTLLLHPPEVKSKENVRQRNQDETLQDEDEAERSVARNRTTSDKRKPFCCTRCGKRYFKKRSLKAHLKINTCKKQHKCSWCKKRFMKKGFLDAHARIHTGEKPYQCSLCDEGFRTRYLLKAHGKVHTGDKPYYCSQCDRRYKTKQSLDFHRQTHTGERPHKCSECGEGFRSKYRLTAHQKVHKAPLTCSYCGRIFGARNNLETHERSHQRQKSFLCSQCGKSFSGMSALLKHEGIHASDSPIHCSECGSRVSETRFVTDQRDRGAMRYRCSHCKRDFKSIYHLMFHEKSHLSGKLHPCLQCGEQFSSSDQLEAHQVVHTGGEGLYCCSKCGKLFPR